MSAELAFLEYLRSPEKQYPMPEIFASQFAHSLASQSPKIETISKKTKNIIPHNVEPDLNILTERNLCSTDFKVWVEANSDKPIDDSIVKNFFMSIFALLSQHSSCFERGTFIFQNDTNVLFNILTFNKLKITSSYNCNDPLSEKDTSPVGHPISPKNVHSMGTDTHQGNIVLKTNLDSEAGPCVPAVSGYKKILPARKNHKFERIFIDELNLIDVCNQCKPKTAGETDYRRVALYYPYVLNSALNYVSDFTNNANKIPRTSKLNFLFVKFETRPASGSLIDKMLHLGNFFSGKKTIDNSSNSNVDVIDKEAKIAGIENKIEEPDDGTKPNDDAEPDNDGSPLYEGYTRREDDAYTTYSNRSSSHITQEETDLQIYKFLGLSTKTLIWYNKNVRIGQEFFVSQQMLEYLLMNYLFNNYKCLEKGKKTSEGGKRKKTQRRHKKTNKKTTKLSQSRRR